MDSVTVEDGYGGEQAGTEEATIAALEARRGHRP